MPFYFHLLLTAAFPLLRASDNSLCLKLESEEGQKSDIEKFSRIQTPHSALSGSGILEVVLWTFTAHYLSLKKKKTFKEEPQVPSASFSSTKAGTHLTNGMFFVFRFFLNALSTYPESQLYWLVLPGPSSLPDSLCRLLRLLSGVAKSLRECPVGAKQCLFNGTTSSEGTGRCTLAGCV